MQSIDHEHYLKYRAITLQITISFFFKKKKKGMGWTFACVFGSASGAFGP